MGEDEGFHWRRQVGGLDSFAVIVDNGKDIRQKELLYSRENTFAWARNISGLTNSPPVTGSKAQFSYEAGMLSV